MASVRIQHADALAEILAHKANRRQQIGIVGYDDRLIEAIEMSIQQQVCGDIDVRALLFGFEHLRVLPGQLAARIANRHSHNMTEEVPEVDFDLRIRGKRPQIHFLTDSLLRIVSKRGHTGGEVADFLDRGLLQNQLTQLLEIEPFERRLPQYSVVEIETIDINKGLQGTRPPT